MRATAVYFHPQEGFKAVKMGFSWPGFFFIWIWAFAKGLARVGTLLLILWLMINGIYMLAVMSDWDHTDITYAFVLLAIMALVGFCGNQWQENSLAKRGYKMANMIKNKSAREAVFETKSAIYPKDPLAQRAEPAKTPLAH